MRSDILRVRILELLEEFRVMNTKEVCRAINIGEKRPPCPKGIPKYRNNRSNSLCHLCEIHNSMVRYNLFKLERMGFVKSRLMRFWDTRTEISKCVTDRFRFWYLDDADLENLVLKQTMPYYLAPP